MGVAAVAVAPAVTFASGNPTRFSILPDDPGFQNYCRFPRVGVILDGKPCMGKGSPIVVTADSEKGFVLAYPEHHPQTLPQDVYRKIPGVVVFDLGDVDNGPGEYMASETDETLRASVARLQREVVRLKRSFLTPENGQLVLIDPSTGEHTLFNQPRIKFTA